MSQQLIDRKSPQYESLLQGLQKKDPRLYDILQLMSKDITGILNVVDPIKATVSRMEAQTITPPGPPTTFIGTVGETAITFIWGADDANVRFYELRKGDTWETATYVLRTSSIAAAINPIAAGTHTYLLKTLSGSLVPCETALSCVVTVNAPQAPIVTTQVVDNNVLIYWSVPDSDFAIDHYIVSKDSVPFATLSGTFTAKFEVVSGTYTYTVQAVDLAGNVGAGGNSSATVRQPPDYNILDQRDFTFLLGTHVNTYAESSCLFGCVDLTETYENHFTSKSWSTPQDQINANYDLYIQENLLTGSYTEDFDYGTLLGNVIVNYDYLYETLATTSAVTVTVKTYHKVNSGDSWTGPLTGKSCYIASFRYLRTVVELSAADADRMCKISSFKCRLDVKREVDSGYISALAADSGGTIAYFNKAFRDIDAIETTAQTPNPITVIVDFVDAPNPTQFKVLCYDSGGNRVDMVVYWMARGIV